MIAFLENNLIAIYLVFVLTVCEACFWGIRCVTRRERIARGDRG